MTEDSSQTDSASSVALRLRRARRRTAKARRQVQAQEQSREVPRAPSPVPTQVPAPARGSGRFDGKTLPITMYLSEAMLKVIDHYVFERKRHDRGVSRISFVREVLEPVVERLVEEGYGDEGILSD